MVPRLSDVPAIMTMETFRKEDDRLLTEEIGLPQTSSWTFLDRRIRRNIKTLDGKRCFTCQCTIKMKCCPHELLCRRLSDADKAMSHTNDETFHYTCWLNYKTNKYNIRRRAKCAEKKAARIHAPEDPPDGYEPLGDDQTDAEAVAEPAAGEGYEPINDGDFAGYEPV